MGPTGRPYRERGDSAATGAAPRRRAGVTAYLAMPPGRASATVAVLHAWWGRTASVTGLCDDLAARGYAAVAPDLYDGEVAATAEEAAALRHRRRATPAWRHIVADVEQARAASGADRLGQVGLSMGGHWALWLAKQARPEVPPILATTVFYATRSGDYSASRSAFQLHLADRDPFVSPAGVDRLEHQLRTAGRPLEVHRYPGTGHWFLERDRPEAYDAAAAALAWQRTVDFLDRHLRR